MPTLKQYIDRCIAVAGSRAAMPCNNTISMARDTGVFYAPYDGYLQIFTGFDSANKQTMRAQVEGNALSVTHWLPMTASVAMILPMKKGQKANLSVPDTSGSLHFVKTMGTVVGGGLSG